MKKVTVAILFLLSSIAFAADKDDEGGEMKPVDPKAAQEKCQAWAKEDGIAKDELDKYIADCVKDLTGN